MVNEALDGIPLDITGRLTIPEVFEIQAFSAELLSTSTELFLERARGLLHETESQ
jgi:hypothetical protein